MRTEFEYILKLDREKIIDELDNLFNEGQFRSIYEICTQLELDDKSPQDLYIRSFQFDVMYILSMSEKAVKMGKELLEKEEVKNQKYRKLGIQTELFMMQFWRGGRDEANRIRDEISDIFDELLQDLPNSEFEQLNARTLIHYGTFEMRCQISLNNPIKAEEAYNWTIDLAKKYKWDARRALIQMTYCHYLIGNFQFRDAEEKLKEIFEYSTDNFLNAGVNSNLAKLYNEMGMIDEALHHIHKTIELEKEIPRPSRDVALTFYEYSIILQKLGRFEEAYDNILLGFTMTKKLGHEKELFSFYGLLIRYSFDLNNRTQARDWYIEYISHYTSIDKKIEMPESYQTQNRLIKADYLSRSQIMREKFEAREMMEELIEDPPKSIKFKNWVSAYHILCRLILDDIRNMIDHSDELIDEEKELVSQLKNYTRVLEEVANNSGQQIELIQINILYTYIYLAFLDFEKVEHHMNKAVELSEKLGVQNVWLSKAQSDTLRAMNKDDFDQWNINKDLLSYDFHNSINNIIHSVPRLQILLYLANNIKASFSELSDKLDFTSGKLTKHLSKLEEVGYISKFKEFVETKFLTYFSLTDSGMSEFRMYSELLTSFLK